MRNKNNLVLYVDKDLVEKSKDLGFNLSKTFENHLKHLMTQFSTGNSVNNFESQENKTVTVGLPGFEPGSIEPKSTSLNVVAGLGGLSGYVEIGFLFIGWVVWLCRLFG